MKRKWFLIMAGLTLSGMVMGLDAGPRQAARSTWHHESCPLARQGGGEDARGTVGMTAVPQTVREGRDRERIGRASGVTTMIGLLGDLLSPATAEAAVVLSPRKEKTPRRANTARKRGKAAGKHGKAMGAQSDRVRLITADKKKRAVRQALAATANTIRKRWSGGRCEPQSLTYARQRSGIMRSRTGPENGPLTWFASEKRLGMTSDHPVAGSVLILGADRGHGMATGHVAYVEQASPSGPSRYRLLFSHTNYDRRCSLETNIEAVYNSSAKTLDIFSGAWQPWGRGLKVAGFIHQE